MLTTTYNLGGNESILINETFEEDYVSDYSEKYNLTSNQNSGLAPFKMAVREIMPYDKASGQGGNVVNTANGGTIYGPQQTDNSGITGGLIGGALGGVVGSYDTSKSNLHFDGGLYSVQNLSENLKSGSKGDEVEILQKRLNELSNEGLIVDGDFGNKTFEAVNRFKNRYNLGNTGEYKGVVGQQTWKYLFPDIEKENNVTNGYEDYSEVDKMVKTRLEQTNYLSDNNQDLNSALDEFKNKNGISSEVGVSVITFRKLFEGGDGTKWNVLPVDEKLKKFVEVAINQVGYFEKMSDGVTSGNLNWTKYGNWYYGSVVYGEKYYWCATFVSWCANEAGIKASYAGATDSIVPHYEGCGKGIEYYKNNQRYYLQSSGYIPVAGDIFFESTGGYPNGTGHTGIVVGYKDGFVYTVEGNSTNKVRYRKSAINRFYSFGNNGGQFEFDLDLIQHIADEKPGSAL